MALFSIVILFACCQSETANTESSNGESTLKLYDLSKYQCQ